MAPDKRVVAGAALALAAGCAGLLLYKRLKKPKVFFQDGIRVAIVGTGWGVKVQVPQFRAAGINIFAICSREQKRASELAAQNNITHAFSSYESLLSVDKVDLVSIVTPVYLHASQAIAAIKAGKHVLCDKPLCLNADEAEEMLSAHQAHPEKLVIIDHELRFTPAFLRARERLRRGDLGRIYLAHARVLIPAGKATHTWWSDASLGGGALGAVGSHIIDSFRFLLDAEVEEVSAHLQTLVKHLPDAGGVLKEVTSDDCTALQLRLAPRIAARGSPSWAGHNDDAGAGAVRAHVLLGLRGAARVDSHLVISGEQGGLVISFADGSLKATDAAGKVIENVPAGLGSPFAKTGTLALGRALQAALGPKRDLSALEPAATLEDGVYTQYALDAARASSANDGKWIRAWNGNLESEDC